MILYGRIRKKSGSTRKREKANSTAAELSSKRRREEGEFGLSMSIHGGEPRIRLLIDRATLNNLNYIRGGALRWLSTQAGGQKRKNPHLYLGWIYFGAGKKVLQRKRGTIKNPSKHLMALRQREKIHSIVGKQDEGEIRTDQDKKTRGGN